MSQGVLDRAATVADLQRALREVPQSSGHLGPRTEPGSVESAIVVLGAQSNVGASTLAAALADALASRPQASPVRLVDLAERRHSGLLCAAERELGEEAGGWRLGRRGPITVERQAQGPGGSDHVTGLRCVPGSEAVIDAGLSIEQLDSSAVWLRDLIGSGRVVLACAASVPGVRRAEAALSRLPVEPYVAAVGTERWSAPVLASAGPLLRKTHAAGRTFVVPRDKRLAVEGINDQPLSKPVLAAASSAPRRAHTDHP